MEFEKVFGRKPVFGMIHTSLSSGMSMLELAKREIEIYLKNGIYPLIENYFGSTEDCEEVLKWIYSEHPDAVYGVNILGDYPLAFELAGKYGAKFIQIDSVCGHLDTDRDEDYAECLSFYRKQHPDILLFGGVRFKYQAVRSGRSVEADLLIGKDRCDAIVCTGTGTGQSTPFGKVKEFKKVVGKTPVIVGAGVTASTARETATIANGAIVGSWLKEGHQAIGTVNKSYVEEFMRNWNKGVTDGPVKEGADLYEELMNNENYKGNDFKWNKTDNDRMQTVSTLVGEYWKPRYLLDHNREIAYEIMNKHQRWVHFNVDDINWESLQGLKEEAILNASRLSAHYPSFIRNYDSGLAIVEWQLIPDGMYWMDEDGYGMTSDVVTPVYAVVNRDLKVLVKFRFIGNDYKQLESMRGEAIKNAQILDDLTIE